MPAPAASSLLTPLLHSGAFWALASAFLWACAVILFALAGETIPPLALNLYKGVVAIVVLAPLAVVFTGDAWPDWPAQTWLVLAFSGIVGIAVADTLFFMALNRLGAGFNAVVMCLYFPIIAVMSHLFLHEVLPATTLLGGALVIAGILVGADGRPRQGADRRVTITGIGLGILALLSMALGVVAMQPILVREPVLWTTTARLLAGTAALVPVVWFGPERAAFARLIRPSPLWRHALPGAVLGGALSMLAWIAGFALTQTSRAAILNQLSTIFVFVLAAIVLKEPVTRRRLVAVTLAFAGALVVMIA